MSFVSLCVCFTMFILCFIVSMIFSWLISMIGDNKEEGYFAGVFIDNVAIAMLITVLLVQNNLI